jgi:hypothetical protein
MSVIIVTASGHRGRHRRGRRPTQDRARARPVPVRARRRAEPPAARPIQKIAARRAGVGYAACQFVLTRPRIAIRRSSWRSPRPVRLLRLAALGAGVWLAPALAQTPSPPPQRPPVSVAVKPATRGDMIYRIEQICSVQPMASVAVRSRVEAQVEKILVPDGATVREGEVLVQLDSRQIQAQIRQAEATLEKDKATLAQNNRDIARFSDLVKKAGDDAGQSRQRPHRGRRHHGAARR